MTLENECALSYYTKVAEISPAHGVVLVQNQEDNKFYVRKDLAVYNPEVFAYLMAHPVKNMPRILRLAEDNNKLTIIEEYIAGPTLDELLAQHGPFSDAVIAGWVQQLCAILQALHNAVPAIVHRDIKPTNIILSPDGIIKLLDMDAAKICDDAKNCDTVLMGTAGYAAPEQYGFSSSTVQTDIFALGVLMNVLSTGAMPQEAPCKSRLAPIIRKCTQLDPKGRYSSVGQLSAALQKFIGPSQALAPTLQPYGWKRFLPPGFRGRNPLAILCGVLGYTLLTSLCFSMTTNGVSTGPRVFITRIGMFCTMLAIVLFSGDYLNVQAFLPPCRNRNLPIRILAIVLADVAIFFVGVLITALLVS